MLLEGGQIGGLHNDTTYSEVRLFIIYHTTKLRLVINDRSFHTGHWPATRMKWSGRVFYLLLYFKPSNFFTVYFIDLKMALVQAYYRIEHSAGKIQKTHVISPEITQNSSEITPFGLCSEYIYGLTRFFMQMG
jgi:hypothetical protein